MALKVRDLLQLQGLQSFHLVSGERGLDRDVCGAGIADHEFAAETVSHNDPPFDKESIVFSSLLFAQNDQSLIIKAVRKLHDSGTSAFAYKKVFFQELPQEVLDFSNKHGYPIFAFGENLCFNNILYEVLGAVQKENSQLLAEQNIGRMIEQELPKMTVREISKSISFFFQPYVMAVYVWPRHTDGSLDVQRIMRNLYLSQNLKNKCVACRYGKGVFLILSSAHSEIEPFSLILQEAMDQLSIDQASVFWCRSNAHRPYDDLDRCLQESYHTYLAGIADQRVYTSYEEIGSYRYLIPLGKQAHLRQFCQSWLNKLLGREELLQTAVIFIRNKGDLAVTAYECNCHQNTVRYRLSRIRNIMGIENGTDAEFYTQLSTAIRIYLLEHLTQ